MGAQLLPIGISSHNCGKAAGNPQQPEERKTVSVAVVEAPVKPDVSKYSQGGHEADDSPAALGKGPVPPDGD